MSTHVSHWILIGAAVREGVEFTTCGLGIPCRGCTAVSPTLSTQFTIVGLNPVELRFGIGCAKTGKIGLIPEFSVREPLNSLCLFNGLVLVVPDIPPGPRRNVF